MQRSTRSMFQISMTIIQPGSPTSTAMNPGHPNIRTRSLTAARPARFAPTVDDDGP